MGPQSDLVKDTDPLETIEGRTRQDMERKLPSDGHSLAGDDREGIVRKKN